jgi:hypothetical protein
MVEEDTNGAPLGDVSSHHSRDGASQDSRAKRCVCSAFSIRCAQSIITASALETHSRFEVAEGPNINLVKKYINRVATGLCYPRQYLPYIA